jgi:hypothetical protein
MGHVAKKERHSSVADPPAGLWPRRKLLPASRREVMNADVLWVHDDDGRIVVSDS